MALGPEFFGLLMILTAWVISTVEVLKKGKELADPVMMFFFLLGTVIFAFSSLIRPNPVYVIINISIAVLAFINFFYIPHKMRTIKKELKPFKKGGVQIK